MLSIMQVQSVAGHAFAELVERAAACDRIRGVLALLKRYDNLFRLPTRIRQASERGLYDQVRPLLTPRTYIIKFLSGRINRYRGHHFSTSSVFVWGMIPLQGRQYFHSIISRYG